MRFIVCVTLKEKKKTNQTKTSPAFPATVLFYDALSQFIQKQLYKVWISLLFIYFIEVKGKKKILWAQLQL